MAGLNDFFVVLSVTRIFQQVAEYQNPGLFVLFDVLVSNILPLLLSNRTRSEQKAGKTLVTLTPLFQRSQKVSVPIFKPTPNANAPPMIVLKKTPVR